MQGLLTHYALMDAQEESVRRPLPLAIVLYHIYLKTVHSGMTMEQVLALDDVEFGRFGAEALQITCSAGLFPYEQDFVPGIYLSFFHGVGVGATPTEDMVRGFIRFGPTALALTPPLFFPQGWSLSMGQLDGRTIRDNRPIMVTENMSMDELKALFRQAPLGRGAVRPLNPSLEFNPCVPCAEGVLPDLYRSISTDDCESSSLDARQAKHALIQFFEQSLRSRGQSSEDTAARVAELKRVCEGWKVFKGFTDGSWSLMSRFVDRLGSMLSARHLRVMTGVGLATGASAEEIKAEQAEFCGHCFNVGWLKTPSMSKSVQFLLEGTSAMQSLHVTDSSPRVTVRLMDAETEQSLGTKTMDMPSFLSALSSTVMSLSAVMNKPNGGRPPDWGWPMDLQITGWLGKTVVAPTLDSADSTPLSFYHRIMYMGWPCTEAGQGCMPVEEGQTDGIMAGCHPYKLADQAIRGVDAALSDSCVRCMAEVMEEAVPPQAPLELVQKIGNLWMKCRPLEQINTEAKREAGVKYHRVVCMESPCAPEYLAIIHEARRRLAVEANRINDTRADSDGCRLYSLLEGVDDLLCIDVPDKTIAMMTIVDSIKQARKNINWPMVEPVKKKDGAIRCEGARPYTERSYRA
jgi:hypothetical protein